MPRYESRFLHHRSDHGTSVVTRDRHRGRFEHHRSDDGTSVVIGDRHTRKLYDMNDQAFIHCAVNNIDLRPEDLKFAYWRSRGEREIDHNVVAETLIAMAGYIQRVASDSADPYFDHWWDVSRNAGRPYMRWFVINCLQNRPRPEPEPMLTQWCLSRGKILVVDRRLGGRYNAEQQAFIVCAVDILGLTDSQIDVAYWRFRGRPRSPNMDSTLVAIADYVQHQLSYDVDGLGHWRHVWSMAEKSHMREVVWYHLCDST